MSGSDRKSRSLQLRKGDLVVVAESGGAPFCSSSTATRAQYPLRTGVQVRARHLARIAGVRCEEPQPQVFLRHLLMHLPHPAQVQRAAARISTVLAVGEQCVERVQSLRCVRHPRPLLSRVACEGRVTRVCG